MRLEALELVVRRQPRILVVEVDDEPYGDEVVADVTFTIDKGKAQIIEGQYYPGAKDETLILGVSAK